ncbi:hypothetical protein Xentx_01422 [Xenorhabdus thuongxuanensis]|uniref:Uncharacterized protein n=1 Tax=Xenorhabdus thuongxuanensis TaxID=1873484 RepID=A0A1Q5U5C0_9GAMM|nr:hypothetical protein Xentx_01422 [Xenorhabdus thuongxuanensis]
MLRRLLFCFNKCMSVIYIVARIWEDHILKERTACYLFSIEYIDIKNDKAIENIMLNSKYKILDYLIILYLRKNAFFMTESKIIFCNTGCFLL